MRNRLSLSWVAVCLATLPAWSLDIDRKTVKIRYLEVPAATVAGLDYAGVRVEVGYGELSVGEPVLRTTKSWCVPEHSKNKIKDAVELPTHYYEVPYRAENGVMVVRDGDGRTIWAERIDELESSERFGYDQCAYLFPGPLKEAWARSQGSFHHQVRTSVLGYFEGSAERALDDALFFNVVEERVPLYRYEDKVHDYSDLNRATELAEAGYAAAQAEVAGLSTAGREALEQATELWLAALEESDLADKKARINKKVSVRLHESLGVALLALDDPTEALYHMERSSLLRLVKTSRSGGTGSGDLHERALRRKERARKNGALPDDPAELQAAIATSDRFRGHVPIGLTPPTDLPRLRAEYRAFLDDEIGNAYAAERADREENVAAGRENPYQRRVGQSASQGFFLFLMPYPEKLDTFPVEICDLDFLNRLRVQGHTFERLPEELGRLKNLEVLNLSKNRLTRLPVAIGELENLEKLVLSGNRLETLPDEIERLGKLKSLELKDNPLAPGELDRLKKLLPKTKIKS